MTTPAAKDAAAPLVFDAPLALFGGAPHPAGAVAAAAARCAHLVAADGGADLLAAAGRAPEAVIGDMDSLAAPEVWEARLGPRFLRVDEQDSTDLEKCLRLTRAPLTLGVGFLGARLDHSLAALHALMTVPDRRVALIGARDVLFLSPPVWRCRLAVGARVSLFPMAPVTGVASAGLEWPLRRLAMAPGRRIGTSNRAAAAEVTVEVDAPAAVVAVDPDFLPDVMDGLAAATPWPAPAAG